MIAALVPLIPGPDPRGMTPQGNALASGLMQALPQLPLLDQAVIFSIAGGAISPGGNDLFTKNVMSAAAAAVVVGIGAGYLAGRLLRKTR